MRVAFSILFWGYLALSSIALFVVALCIFVLSYPIDRNGRLLHWYSAYWAAHYVRINPIWRLVLDGETAFDRRGPYVIVSNHQSFADILILYCTHLPFKWVSKSSVFKVPFIGWNMTLNRYVALQRGDKASIEKMAAACRAWLDRGVSVLLFPEGTRSPDGALGRFKSGAFRLARDARVPILPIVLDGTRDALPKHGLVMRASADCRVRILPPIDATQFPSTEAASDAVREAMARALAELRA